MITLPELLKDPKYRAFFLQVPKTLVPPPGQKPWRLYIQREADGPWAKKDFEKYADAFRKLAAELKRGAVHDGAIQSRGIAYAPPERVAKVTKGGRPVWARNGQNQIMVDRDGNRIQRTVVVVWRPKLEPQDEPHTWCTYCRRPTVFRWFTNHHSIRGTELAGLVDPSKQRCTICGATEEFVRGTLGTSRRPSYDPRDVLVAGRRARR